MADSPLDSGPAVDTSIHENIARGYQHLGNVVQEPFEPGVTGAMVLKSREAQAEAIQALANGIDKGFSPLIDKMISIGQRQQAASEYAAGAKAGLAGSNVPGATGGQSGDAAASQVTRGPDGGLNVLPSLRALLGADPAGTISPAYAQGHAAAEQVTMANLASETHQNYIGDPEGFNGAWATIIQGRNYGALGEPYATQAALAAAKVGNEHYREILARYTSAKLGAEGESVQTQIGQVANDMSELARNGKLNSPEYAAKQDQFQDLNDQLSKNPAYTGKFDPSEKVDQKLHADIGDHIVGLVDSNFSQGKSAALKAGQDAIDKIPGLSDTEREEFLRKVNNRITYNTGINADAVAANKGDIEKARTSPQPVSDEVWAGLSKRAADSGDVNTVHEVEAIRQAHRDSPMANGLTPSQVGTPGSLAPTGALAPLKLASPNVDVANVDNRLLDSVTAGATHLPPGYSVQVNEGYNPSGHVHDSQHHIAGTGALDIQIIGPNGAIPNRGQDSTGLYKQLAVSAYAEMNARHPELNGKLAWGGNFETSPGSGTPDLMHFDIGGDRGHLGRLADMAGGGTPLSPYGGAPGNPAILAKIRAGAATAGVDPDMMERIYRGEGASGYVGDNGSSFGPFQLHMGGLAPGKNSGPGMGDDFKRETGLDPRNPSTVDAQIAWVSKKLMEDPSLISNFHGYRPGTQVGGPLPATASGITATPLNTPSAPGALGGYIEGLDQNDKQRKVAADSLSASIDFSTKNGGTPDPKYLASNAQLSDGDPAKMERAAQLQGTAIGNVGAQYGPSAAAAYREQIDQQYKGGDIYTAAVNKAIADRHDVERTAAIEHPLEYAHQIGIAGAPMQINYNDPGSVAQGFAANVQTTSRLNAREPGVAVTAVPKSMVPEVTSALASADPRIAQNILSAIETLSPEARTATLTGDEHAIGKAVVGMARSGDPVRMGAAFGVMDKELSANQLTFDSKFGEGAKAELRDWQGRRQFQTTAQIAKDLATANDPSTISAIKVREAEADNILKAVASKDVVAGLTNTGGVVSKINPFRTDYTPISNSAAASADGLKADYDKAYRYQYGQTGDKDLADSFAKEQVGTKWTISPANGGRLMPWAPETAYPQVSGSKTYIGDQLKEFVAVNGHPGAEGHLVPDSRTDDEIHSGKPPSYQVVIKAIDGPSKGTWQALTGPDGIRANRFYADPMAAKTAIENIEQVGAIPTWQGTPP